MMATRLPPTGHVLERTEGGKQSKCESCKKVVSKQCKKCDIGLNMDKSYENWHS